MVTHPSDDAPERLTTTEARQAITPHRLRYMLAFGVLIVIAGFLIAYWFGH